MKSNHPIGALGLLGAALAALVGACGADSSGTSKVVTFRQSNLVSDQAGVGTHVDANLVNPWGVAFGPSTPIWVANNHTGTLTAYDGNGATATPPVVVTVPAPDGGGTGAPTGLVYNGTSGFHGDTFITATEDGTIAGWSSGASATIRVDRSAAGAVYKGLAIGTVGSATYLYATNFVGGTIETFDENYAPITLGAFSDPTSASGFAPFGVQNLGGKLYVTYAQRVGDDPDETAGPGLGYVAVFELDGTFVTRLVSQGSLNAPWGLAIAPADFGAFSNSLLVGNFGDGRITAYDVNTGAERGQLEDANGAPISVKGLWGITAGNGGSAGSSTSLYFAAGPDDEKRGLFGDLVLAPSSSRSDGGTGGGGGGGYRRR